MFCVRTIGTLVMLVILALTYLLMWEEDLASFNKIGKALVLHYSTWHIYGSL